MKIEDKITPERIEKYLNLTAKARSKATPIIKNNADKKRLESMLRMCDDYSSDARHFLKSGKLVDSFAAIKLCSCLDRCCRKNRSLGWT